MEQQGDDAVKDLNRSEAIEKIKELVKHNNICFFTTNLHELPLQSRPMSTQEVDDNGNLWFLSSRKSNKNVEVDEDPRVQLFFSNKSDSEFLSIYGEATVYNNKHTIEEIWSPIAKVWFQEGKDDPDVTAIKVAPTDAYYWDTKDGKMVSLIKMIASLVAGRTMDGGVEGEMKM
jgi:general stress protein 26